MPWTGPSAFAVRIGMVVLAVECNSVICCWAGDDLDDFDMTY